MTDSDFRLVDMVSSSCLTWHATHSVPLRQAMANNVAVMDSDEAMPSVLLGDAVGKAAPGNGTQLATVAAVAERLAELETALVAQAAMVVAKRCALCTPFCCSAGCSRLQPAKSRTEADQPSACSSTVCSPVFMTSSCAWSVRTRSWRAEAGSLGTLYWVAHNV